ncbi:MAG: DUF2520 domain-containing protein [Crocinitomicaceae bacterium]|nr:DUF2520 domain-containing protein [Crocinitomicaceae bacterium]
MEIKSVNIVGSGNVASKLFKMLNEKIRIPSIYARDITCAKNIVRGTTTVPVDQLSKLDLADLTIIAVSDSAISQVINELSGEFSVVHTSGSIDIQILDKFNNYGSLYPLQTISKDSAHDIEIPFLIEGSSKAFEKFLADFAQNILGTRTLVVNSRKRASIHLSAVITSNFTTYLLREAKVLLSEENVDLNILRPLLEETVRKAFELSPEVAQTGPARRKDTLIIEKHLKQIQDSELREVYKLISKKIADYY